MRSAADKYNFNGSYGEGLVIIRGDIRKSFIFCRLSSHSLVQLKTLCFDASLIASYIGRHFFEDWGMKRQRAAINLA